VPMVTPDDDGCDGIDDVADGWVAGGADRACVGADEGAGNGGKGRVLRSITGAGVVVVQATNSKLSVVSMAKLARFGLPASAETNTDLKTICIDLFLP
jgi:hypothetical protein